MEPSPPTPVDVGEATAALFSLQVCVDDISYEPSPPHQSSASARGSVSSAECLLAFQLLQFDIVLFDDGVLHASAVDDGRRYQLTEAQGQSCLFECDPQRLAQDIRADESSALVLLVLLREDHKARLEAFACVRLELPHLAFNGENKRPRVSEWVAVEATWPLVNHQNQSVGSITGSVTLSCLGRALAPHLIAHRFGGGLHVLTRTSSSRVASGPRLRADERVSHEEEGIGSVSSGGRREGEEDPPEAKGASPKKASLPPSPTPKSMDQLRDAAVQCAPEDEDDGLQSNLRSPRPILIRGGSRDQGSGSSRDRRVVDELDRIQIGSRESPRRIGERNPRYNTYISYTREMPRGREERGATAVASVVPDSELPPPLFFHKPKQQKR